MSEESSRERFKAWRAKWGFLAHGELECTKSEFLQAAFNDAERDFAERAAQEVEMLHQLHLPNRIPDCPGLIRALAAGQTEKAKKP